MPQVGSKNTDDACLFQNNLIDFRDENKNKTTHLVVRLPDVVQGKGGRLLVDEAILTRPGQRAKERGAGARAQGVIGAQESAGLAVPAPAPHASHDVLLVCVHVCVRVCACACLAMPRLGLELLH